jgi:hypothetical protein
MPDIETTSAVIDDDDAIAERLLEQREQRIEDTDEKDSEKTGESTYQISQNKMLGLPEKYTVGGQTFTFVAVPNSDMEELRTLIYGWAEPFIFAALAEPAKGGGMDYDVITKMMSQSREANGQEPLTVSEVRRMFRTLFFLQLPEMLTNIINTTLFASPKGTTREAVAKQVGELLPRQFPDLLRAIMDSCGGYPGDESDHFDTP